MRIPAWTPEHRPQPAELVDAIVQRRGGQLLNLDRALLWSEPLARGWNTYLKNVRTGLAASRKLRELGICTVALLTGAKYEYHHHAPDFLHAGGTQAELDALNRVLLGDACSVVNDPELGPVERLVVQYAAQMTQRVQVDDALSSIGSAFGFGASTFGDLEPGPGQVWRPFAITNPTWVNVGEADWVPPGVLPRQCKNFGLEDVDPAMVEKSRRMTPEEKRAKALRRAYRPAIFGEIPRARGDYQDVRMLFEHFHHGH